MGTKYNKKYQDEYRKTHRKEILEYKQLNYEKNKLKIREEQKEYYKRVSQTPKYKARAKARHELYKPEINRQNKLTKIEVLSYYSKGIPKCSCCGERQIQFLTIDHINNDGAEFRKKTKRSGSSLYIWLKRTSFPEGYDVLCFNCNCGRAINGGICPHVLNTSITLEKLERK